MKSKAPIKSSYDLIQEHYWPDAWKMMVCCMLLNMTTRKQVDKVVDLFFSKFNKPEDIISADPSEITEVIKDLGFANKRTSALIRMSFEWTHKKWNNPIELHGLGQYAQDCYDMFVNRLVLDDPSDHALKNYNEWLRMHI